MKHYNSLPILLIDSQLKQKKFKDFYFLTHFTVSLSNIAQIKVQSLHVVSDEVGHLFNKLKINYMYFLIPLVISKSNMVSSIAALPQCTKYPMQCSLPEKKYYYTTVSSHKAKCGLIHTKMKRFSSARTSGVKSYGMGTASEYNRIKIPFTC